MCEMGSSKAVYGRMHGMAYWRIDVFIFTRPRLGDSAVAMGVLCLLYEI